MEIEMQEILRFDCVVFDPVNRTFEILDGTKGTYAFEEIERFAILNENARYRRLPPFFPQQDCQPAFFPILICTSGSRSY